MITTEMLQSMPLSPWHSEAPFLVGDWICGGTWAVIAGPELALLAKGDRGTVGLDHLADYEKRLPGIEATEDVTLRLPFVPGIEDEVKKCRACSGTGEHDCNCDSCDIGCESCEGDGEVVAKGGRAEDPGQRVYRSDDITTIINERLGGLLDGLRVVRLGPTNIDPLGGLDEMGRLVVLVMPIRAEVREAVRP